MAVHDPAGALDRWRGTYHLASLAETDDRAAIAEDYAAAGIPVEVEKLDHTRVAYVEADFPESFAEWLVEVAEGLNAAVALDGMPYSKWRTLDVIGLLKPRTQDVLRFEPQIVLAEIKIDPSQPVVARVIMPSAHRAEGLRGGLGPFPLGTAN